MLYLSSVLEELSKIECSLLRKDVDGDIDIYCNDLNKVKKIISKYGFVLTKKQSNNLEFILFENSKFIILDVANTPVHSSSFKNIEIKNEYLYKYINDPIKNDIWLKSIRYLLSLRTDKKSFEFFKTNKSFLEKNNFYLNYLKTNPFKDNIDINLLFTNKKKFIFKYVKKIYIVELITNKINYHINNLLTKKNIAIIGVDGSGKTTVISTLNNLNNFKTIYMGFKGFKFEKFYHKIIGKNVLFTFLAHIFVLIENFSRLIKAKKYNLYGYNVIFDRYPLIEYKTHKDKKTRLLYYILYKFFYPKPDEVIFLYGKPDEILRRKQEMTMQEIIDEQKLLEKNCDIKIDNLDGKLDETINKVLKEIYRELNEDNN